MHGATAVSVTEPPRVLDSTTESALLVALTMPVAVATVMTWSFWPLLFGIGPTAIAAFRRRSLAMLFIGALLGLAAISVAYVRLDG
jgi:hypothetical protein